MDDLISRQAVKEIRNDGTYIGYSLFPDDDNADYENGFTDAINKVLALPPTQPEIIYCKDCKHLKRSETSSKLMMCQRRGRLLNLVSEFDFCSKAKRRTDEPD